MSIELNLKGVKNMPKLSPNPLIDPETAMEISEMIGRVVADGNTQQEESALVKLIIQKASYLHEAPTVTITEIKR